MFNLDRRAGAGAAMVLIAILLTGCASRGTAPSAPPAVLWTLYEKAVETTRYPKPSAISTYLVPIVRSTPGLRWDEQGRVLMVAWTKRQYYEGSVGKPYTFPVPIWLTAVPFIQDYCRSLGLPPDPLDTRLRQLLGLRPDSTYDAFVQLWVDPKDFFRPCADPEITDRECTINLTIQDSSQDGCPWQDSLQGQTSASWVEVSQDHLGWMCTNWSKSFPSNPREGFPWTALGYTYDWGRPNPVGQSEFVAPQGTKVVIESIMGTAEYCRRP